MQDKALFFLWFFVCKHTYISVRQDPQTLKCSYESRSAPTFLELIHTKKVNRSISEYILRIKAITRPLLAIGDHVIGENKIDAILEGITIGCVRGRGDNVSIRNRPARQLGGKYGYAVIDC